jgi:uncharacterized membrane protein
LHERISDSLCLFLTALGVGFALGILKIILTYSNESHFRLSSAANFASGLKYGFVAVGIFLFIVDVMQLENFLGPLQTFLDSLFA